MGHRTVKRVPLDFDAPMNKVWKGYINPHYKKCPQDGITCFNGENAAAKYLSHLTSIFAVVADSALRGKTHPYCETLPYYGDHPDFLVQPKEIRDRFVSLFKKISGDDADSFIGFQGNKLFWRLLELAGIECKEGPDGKNPAYEWTHCLTCKGQGIDPAMKTEYDAWVDYEPPAGPGWQLWETTSEGSPVSPVFKTPGELAAWCEGNASIFAGERLSKQQWLRIIREDSVEIGSFGLMVDGKFTSIAKNQMGEPSPRDWMPDKKE